MGTFCQHYVHNLKSFFADIDLAPSRDPKTNAAVSDMREEEMKSTTIAVAAGEDPAPATMISGAPKKDHLFLPVVPIRAM